ncbi:hypothetical protein IM538_14075 [Cytobacillus suaedae]|nr:hypothetical protein IM538_14075 [Cytobacillus suaedae]
MRIEPRRLKKLVISFSILLIIIIFSTITNPTKEDYIKFDEARTGIPIPENVRIAKADFYLFSIYATAPEFTVDEYGIVHLGVMGHFFKVTGGQFDDSIWKDFLE